MHDPEGGGCGAREETILDSGCPAANVMQKNPTIPATKPMIGFPLIQATMNGTAMKAAQMMRNALWVMWSWFHFEVMDQPGRGEPARPHLSETGENFAGVATVEGMETPRNIVGPQVMYLRSQQGR